MAQFLLQALQLMHLLLSATICNAGEFMWLRMLLPIIIKGAIQQIVWHAARLPAKRAKTAIAPTMALQT